ncbi:MAG: hypothetical protein VCF24_24575, partial [Candidatus Latescibacterota bacterium]
ATPSFMPPSSGVFVFSLIVNDGQVDSPADEVTITVSAIQIEPSIETLTVDLPGGATMDFVWIETGTFNMGTASLGPSISQNENPQHEVTISQGFV